MLIFLLFKVLHAERLEEQLQVSVREYVQNFVEIRSGQVIIPSLIHQYIQNTGQNMRVFLFDHLDGSKQHQLDNLPGTIWIFSAVFGFLNRYVIYCV